MALSLGRTLYNLAGRHDAGTDKNRPPRPSGDLIWLHAPDEGAATGLASLITRLQEDSGATLLLTCPETVLVPKGVLLQEPPAEHGPTLRSFLDHWRPQVVVCSEGEVRPTLLSELSDRRVPAILINARPPHLPKARDGWFPGLQRAALQSFREILAVDEPSAKALRKAGSRDVKVAGRMEEPSTALPHHEPERAALAMLAATRPIWLAVSVPEAEEAAVIAAHRSALRMAHRLLLIFAPQDPARADVLAAKMEKEEGWNVALRGREEEPDPEISVYIPDSAKEYGLWYRLAPVSFMGGSLSAEGCVRNPMEAAAMGSAIIYGPNPGSFGAVFGRLGAAQAARAVGVGFDLGEAVSDLLAPDRAAKLAQAAWGLASDGVEVTDRVLELIYRLLEESP